MVHLEKLNFKSCGIDAIVANDKVPEFESSKFVFPNLTFLYLQHLSNMRSFHGIQCPRLQELIILRCDELEIFQKEISSSSRIQEDDAIGTPYHLLFDDQVSKHTFQTTDSFILKIKLEGKKYYYMH